jgi:hypothetical protein
MERLYRKVLKNKKLSLWLGIWRIIFSFFTLYFLPIEMLQSKWDTIEKWMLGVSFTYLSWILISGLLLVVNGFSKRPWDTF